MTPAELAGLEALVASEKARQTASGSLKIEETGGVPSLQGDVMAKAYVIKDRNGWRVRIVDKATGNKLPTTSCATKDDAEKAKEKLLREYERPVGVSIREALAAYEAHLAEGGATGENPNNPRTIETTMGRITNIVGRKGGCITGDLTPAAAEAAWKTYCEAPTHLGTSPAIATKRNTLNQLRTFFRWCIAKAWMTADPLAAVKVLGKSGRRKRQLEGVDEAKRFLDKALELGSARDAGAIAAATALYMGDKSVRDQQEGVGQLEAKGTILTIEDAKTEAGNRRLMIPPVLRSPLQQLAAGRQAHEPLFVTKKGRPADRHWVRRAVIRAV